MVLLSPEGQQRPAAEDGPNPKLTGRHLMVDILKLLGAVFTLLSTVIGALVKFIEFIAAW
jgi:hypothetical protein